VHIALFISSLHTGGTQRQITVLAAGMARRDNQVHLLSIYPGGVFWEQVKGNKGVELQSLFERRPRIRVLRALGLLWAPVRLRQIIRESGPDILYSMLDLSNVIARIAMIGSRRPLLVWGFRATERQADYRAEIPYWLCRVLSRTVPLAIANSHKGLGVHRMEGFRMRSYDVVHNGIDTERFRFDVAGRRRIRGAWGVDDEHCVIALIGRLDSRKGHDVFVNMAGQLYREYQHLRFVCIGPGSDSSRSILRRSVATSCLDGAFQVLDEADDMPAVYSATDLVVSASTAEGFPNVVGESMACGRACVVTDVGDSAILVGDCGIVVPPNDAVSLADAVRAALLRLDEIGECGRARIVQEFTVETMVTRTLEAFISAVSRSDSRKAT
jgi:glycosyltransferase involved in cell wall biosynthesis